MTAKRLYRSRSDVMLGGVCSGIAKYLEVDPTLVRLAFLLLLFIGMGGLWIYLILWVIMPEEPKHVNDQVVDVKPVLLDTPIELKKEEVQKAEVKKQVTKKEVQAPTAKKVAATLPKPATDAKKPAQKKPTTSK